MNTVNFDVFEMTENLAGLSALDAIEPVDGLSSDRAIVTGEEDID